MAKSAVNKVEPGQKLPLDKYPVVNLHDLRHDEYGRELLDPVPMQPPAHYTRPPSLIETVREQIRAHHRLAADAEMDTEEDADDFEMDDDANDPSSRYENDFEPSIKNMRENRERIDAYMQELEETVVPPAGGNTAATSFTQAPQGQSANAQPGATPPQRSGGGEDIAQPGGPPTKPAPARRLW